jgi:MFS family permease
MEVGQKIWSRSFILLTAANFLLCVTYYAIISTLPIYLVSELQAGKEDVGLVLAAYTIASILVRPFGGFALDRFGRQTVYLIALGAYTLFFCGYLLQMAIPSLIGLRFMQGLTWGIATIAGSTMAVDIIPSEKRGQGIGYFGLSTTLGMSVGPVFGLFICHHWGYTAMFIGGIIVNLIGLASAAKIKLPRMEKTVPIPFAWRNLFDKNSIVPSFNVLIIMITYGGLLSFIALYGREMGIQNTSLFFLVFSVGIAVSRIAVGKSFDRHGPVNILTICLSLLIIGFPLLVICKNVVGFYVSALIIGFGIGVVFPVFQTIVNNLSDPARRGAANSTLFVALDLGMGGGMVLMGYVAQYFSISATFLVSALFCVLGLIFFRKLTAVHYNRLTKG